MTSHPSCPGGARGPDSRRGGPRITQCTPWGRDNNMSHQPKEDGNSAVQAKPTLFLRVGRVMKLYKKNRDRVTRVQRTAHSPCRAPPWAGLVPCVCGGPIPLVWGHSVATECPAQGVPLGGMHQRLRGQGEAPGGPVHLQMLVVPGSAPQTGGLSRTSVTTLRWARTAGYTTHVKTVF